LIDHFFNLGVAADRAVVGDWAGNGIDCIAVFRDGVWHLDVDGDGLFTARDRCVNFGRKGDLPLAGDWDGNGIDEIAVYRAGQRGATGEWILDTNRNYRIDDGDKRVQMGAAADQPIVGDWDGDGADQIGLMHEGRIEREVRR
jgi:hypothetical protein